VKRLAFLALAAVACAGSPAPRTTYLMRADISEGVTLSDAPRAALGDVEVAAYLAETGLVLETGENEVRAARHHLWAEPLDQSLRVYLRAQISNALGAEIGGDAIAGDPEFTIDVGVEELHGTRGGDARLVASWRLSRPKGDAIEYRFARTRSLARDGYAALADAEVALVGELAAAIAASLRETGVGGPAPSHGSP
jgi:uncharacterized lipoprotein YmbA